MPDTPPDTITIQGLAEREVEATRPHVIVTLEGSSLGTGRAALHQARELRALAEDLAKVGVDESCLHLQDVETSTSGIMRTSKARYTLRIEVPSAAELPDTLGVVSARKDAAVDRVYWRYEGLDAVQDALLEEALRQAKARAARAAAALEHTLLGVHEVHYSFDNTGAPRPQLARAMSSAPKQAVQAEDFGIPLRQSKRVRLVATVRYRVAPLG